MRRNFGHSYTRNQVHVTRFMFKESKRVCRFPSMIHSKKIDPPILTEFFKRAEPHPLLSFFRHPRKVYGELLYSNHIEKMLSVVNPDILHAHFAYPEGWASYRRYRKRIPFVVTLHGYDVLVESSLGYGIRLKKRQLWLAMPYMTRLHLINDKEKIH